MTEEETQRITEVVDDMKKQFEPLDWDSAFGMLSFYREAAFNAEREFMMFMAGGSFPPVYALFAPKMEDVKRLCDQHFENHKRECEIRMETTLRITASPRTPCNTRSEAASRSASGPSC